MVRELLDYNSDTGILTWKVRDEKYFSETNNPYRQKERWNNRYAGKEAYSSIDANGYKVGSILGIHCKAHSIIWLWSKGEWPKIIDHIDGNKTNNKLENIRSVSVQQNSRNRKKPISNSSGVIGVTKFGKRWRVRIKDNKGKMIDLGIVENISEGKILRKKAEEKYGYHENHGR